MWDFLLGLSNSRSHAFPPLYPMLLSCLNFQEKFNNPSTIIWTYWNIRFCIFFKIIVIYHFFPLSWHFYKDSLFIWLMPSLWNLLSVFNFQPQLWLPLMLQDRSLDGLQLGLFDSSSFWVPEANKLFDDRLFLCFFHQCWNANDSFFPQKLRW